MIISDKQTQGRFKFPIRLWKVAALLAFLAVVVMMFRYFSKEEEKTGTRVFFCNAEEVSGAKFAGKPGNFKNGHTQSDERALSGKYSSKTGQAEGLTFGFSFDMTGYLPGETYKITVWRFEEGKSNAGILVAAGNKESEFYESAKVPIDRKESGWEKLQLTINIPESETKPVKTLNIHVYSPGDRTVYFDDLKIELVQEEGLKIAGLPEVELEIKSKNYQKIISKRTEALSAGLLVTGDDDWVKGKLFDSETEKDMSVKLRLKGDWLDHLKGEKWSFRIKAKDPNAWNRMTTFSFQTPAARYFLHEWAFHKVLEQEDILTPRYDFINLKINGEPKGIFAWEEHFEKQLVESKKRREGPIVKFSEDAMWEGRRRFIKHLGYIVERKDFSPTHQQENAAVMPFAEKKTMESPNLKRQFEIAQNLMYQYMQGLKPVSEVFDIERLAKYFALTEAFQTQHSTIWHNQRFYFNPIAGKLEPIGFDGYAQEPYTKYFFLGMGGTNTNKSDVEDAVLKLFLDKKFTERYVHYLHKFTSRDYLNRFFTSIEKQAAKRVRWLEKEYPDYRFKPERFVELAQILHHQIQPFPKSVKAYTQSVSNGKKRLKINSIHHLPVEILGYGSTKNKMTGKLEEPLYLEAQPPRTTWMRATHPRVINEKFGIGNAKMNARKAVLRQELRMFSEIEVPENSRYIYFKMPGVERVFVADILKQRTPTDFSPQQELFENLKITSTDIFEVKDSLVLFKKGKYQTANDILIPEKYKVVFPEGAEIDFIGKAKFISKSPIYIMGTPAEPVRIYSSDKSATGFTVLSPGDSCILQHAVFSNFNTLNHKGWTLTGAVTFYETEVALENCIFEGNQCEDGLNIIRSEFKMKQCTVRQAPSDGFDCDFCIGEIHKSVFENTINDGMDFSGSTISVYETLADNCGDKGISVGEESDVSIFDSRIVKSVIGAASKDYSLLIVDNLLLDDCETGFAGYQKKPEYGPSKILVKDFKENNLRRLYSLGKGCSIQFPNEKPILN